MELPFRIQTEPGDQPVLSVDGAFGAPGLNLSHWPGNRTPAELAHELSTGIALAFARLPPERRSELAAGLQAVVNNHYDTDGTLAAFAILRPEQALPRAAAMLDAAAAGDFFRVPSEAAFAIDAIVGAFADSERSPIAAELRGLSDRERHERATRALLERLPALLDGELAPYEPLFGPALADLRADIADLGAAARDDIVHLDLCVFTAAPGAVSTRAGAPPCFDPGRHALFGSTRADRVLVVGPERSGLGATYRLILNTTSWFDLPGRPRAARPDLPALARRLQELEPEGAEAPARWRAQPLTNAAPELWHGLEQGTSFAEHSTVLRPSRLPPAQVRRELVEALRAVWVFPE